MATLSPIGPSDIAELATITLAGEAIVWPGSAASYMRRSRRNTGYLTNSERMQQWVFRNNARRNPELMRLEVYLLINLTLRSVSSYLLHKHRLWVVVTYLLASAIPFHSVSCQSLIYTWRIVRMLTISGCTDSPCSSTSPPTGGKTATTATTQDTQGFIDTCAAFCSAKTSFLAGWWNGGRSFACLCGYSGQQATCSNGDYSYARFERV